MNHLVQILRPLHGIMQEAEVYKSTFLNTIPLNMQAIGNPNSFLNLGVPYTIHIVAPITTVRDLTIGQTDIVLNAPVWNPAGKLNMKFIRTNSLGVPGSCPDAPMCEVQNSLQIARGNAPLICLLKSIIRTMM